MPSKPLYIKLREKRNRPPEGEPWIWLTRELIESEAWHTAPINTRRVVERLLIEHMAHAGTENGNLVCTHEQLQAFGIGRRLVHVAVHDAIKRGLIDRTVKGKRSSGPERLPARYALGWIGHHDGGSALNRWKAWSIPPKAPRPVVPVDGDIKSTSQKGGRANGGKRHPLPHESEVAPPHESEVGNVQKVRQGKCFSEEQQTNGRIDDERQVDLEELIEAKRIS